MTTKAEKRQLVYEGLRQLKLEKEKLAERKHALITQFVLAHAHLPIEEFFVKMCIYAGFEHALSWYRRVYDLSMPKARQELLGLLRKHMRKHKCC